MLIPSTSTAGRTRRYTSTLYIHRTTHKLDFKPVNGGERYVFQPPNVSDSLPTRHTLAPPFTDRTGLQQAETVAQNHHPVRQEELDLYFL